MKRTVVLVVAVFLATSAVALPPVSAQDGDISVEVLVAGEEYDDGERVEVDDDELTVNVSVESENELNAFESRLHSRSILVGVTGNSYNTSHLVETRVGPNEYTVVVEDVDGNVERHTVNFYKEATTARELQTVVERLQNRKERLEDDIDTLEDRRDELRETRDNLSDRLNETEADGDGSDGSGADDEQEPQGLPGFGAVVALVALALVAVRRK
ncbi:MAG: PGF-CTERM sorting domain-containing protein [Halobacteriales archaeon]